MIPIYELPFYNGSTAKPDNDGYPMALPVELYYDADLRMLRLNNKPSTKVILNRAYAKGSLVDGSLSSESGASYIASVIDYIRYWSDCIPDSRILEIGSGTGRILRKMKQVGFTNLTGIEPGHHVMVDGLEGVKIVREYFPEGISGCYDLLLNFAVWEHIEKPLEFFRKCMGVLPDDGRMIFSVPNCEPYVRTGDLSIFIHEHYSYFTEESVRRITQKCCMSLLDIRVLHGMLIGVVSKTSLKQALSDKEEDGIARIFEVNYWNCIQNSLNSVRRFVDGFSHQKDIAVYAPGRAINALSIINAYHVRLVDDSSEMHDRYLPGFANSIESFDDICVNPPECILVFSATFGELIKNKCASASRLMDTKIVLISDLFSI